jgi:cell division protein FtsI/penicillin-binding protein 2
MAGFFCLAARCVYLQFLKSDYFSSESAKQRQKWVIQQPQRGVILDSKGRVLAASNEIQVIFAEPRAIKDLEAVSQKLSKILRIDAARIFQMIESSENPGYAKIKAGANEEECKQASKINGISVHSYWQRYYPTGPLASHVVGFTSDDNRGQEGVELKYEKDLCGDEGQNIVFADVLRRPVRLKEQTAQLKDGCGVILTIDSAIQEFTGYWPLFRCRITTRTRRYGHLICRVSATGRYATSTSREA